MMMKRLATALAALLLSASAMGKQDPYAAANETWISLSGTVVAVTSGETFTLSYGDGIVTVEMDDWDLAADALKLVKGDRVSVTGQVDDDMFETTTIEANSVYVENLGTYFYASPADEEDSFVNLRMPVTPSAMLVKGTVTDVDGRKFTVNTGFRRILVDTSDMPYDPMDDKGRQNVRKGDRVTVAGTMNKDFWENRELEADNIVVLSMARKKTAS